jgi:RNA polymerase sigma-70 factor (ECF subfamily)
VNTFYYFINTFLLINIYKIIILVLKKNICATFFTIITSFILNWKLEINKFITLLKPVYNESLRYCRAICSGKSYAESYDVLQQSLLQAMESFHTLKDDGKFKNWYFKIITRCYYDYFRKSFWHKFQPLEKVKSVNRLPEIYDSAKTNENRLLLSQALSYISEKEKITLLLFEIAGFSIEEIVVIQNERSISAVKSRLSRTRQKLKNIINELEISSKRRNFALAEKYTDSVENETLKAISGIKSDIKYGK